MGSAGFALLSTAGLPTGIGVDSACQYAFCSANAWSLVRPLLSAAYAIPETPATRAVVTAMRFIIENLLLMTAPLSNGKVVG
jgi:hypothetical protein